MKASSKDIIVASIAGSLIASYLIAMLLKVQLTEEIWIIAFASAVFGSLIENNILKNFVKKKR